MFSKMGVPEQLFFETKWLTALVVAFLDGDSEGTKTSPGGRDIKGREQSPLRKKMHVEPTQKFSSRECPHALCL